MNRDQVIQFCEAAIPFADDLVAVAERCELNTVKRAAAFLAQVAHESGAFHYVAENLNYSRAALLAVFPKYFTIETSGQYARNPQRIANRVYGGRLGNGDEASGDGWRYRGRGLIQVTGRDNYGDCSFWMFGDERLVSEPELLERPRYACESAGWYWDSRQCNQLADAGNFEALTKKINGGLHGHDDHDRSDLDTRMDWYIRAQTILGETP